jgi:glutamate-1-semialdehyde aminotransferase
VFVEEAKGARVSTSTVTNTSISASATRARWPGIRRAGVQALAAQAARGSTAMLPTEDAAWVGEELARRFGLPFWQFALTATDANRFALRLAREVTGRGKVLVFDWCYHGSVDESLAGMEAGIVGPRRGTWGRQSIPR